MKSTLTTLAAAAALMIGFSAPTSAAPAERKWTDLGAVHNWRIIADADLCLGISDYSNGTLLRFGFNVSGAAFISVINSEWRIPEGEYEVMVAIDRIPPQRYRAKAEGKWVTWGYPTDEPALSALSNGTLLTVTIGQTTYRYALSGSRDVLETLRRCISARMAATNPFAAPPAASPSPANPFSETASNPYRRM